MSSILDAWNTNRPIFYRLPNRNEGGYDNDVSDWLTAYWDKEVAGTKQKVDDIGAKQINPMLSDSSWLDYLSILFGWSSKHWQKSWSEKSKRLLLVRSYEIWTRKGNKDILVYVLNSLGLKNRVLEIGDFLIGINEVGDPIGTNPWQVQIILPLKYQMGAELTLVKYVVERFVPCWIKVFYQYDDTPFLVAELLEINENAVLANSINQAIEI